MIDGLNQGNLVRIYGSKSREEVINVLVNVNVLVNGIKIIDMINSIFIKYHLDVWSLR